MAIRVNLTGSSFGYFLSIGTSIDPIIILFPEIWSIEGYYVVSEGQFDLVLWFYFKIIKIKIEV
jgi:hypothetical protein